VEVAAPVGGRPDETVAEPRRRPGAEVGIPPLVTLLAVGLGLAAGWHGVDVAASVHRIDEFGRYGWSLWDGAWYGGQWTLDYSVLFAPAAWLLGLPALSLMAAMVATVAFRDLAARAADRTDARAVAATEPSRWAPVLGRLPAAARPSGRGMITPGAVLAAAVVLAVSNLVQTSIGQLPYLTGEAVGLAALALAARRRWLAAGALALMCSLLSPLAGLFLGLSLGAWWLRTVPWPARGIETGRRAGAGRRIGPLVGIAALAVAAAAPIVATSALFPGEGQMPFSVTDCCWDLAIAAAVGLAAPRRLRVLRTGVVLYAIGLVASLAVASPIGGNMGRLGDALALPVATLLLWSRWRAVLGLVAIPLFLSSWVPAADAIVHGSASPSTTAAFYRPLDRWLAARDPGGIWGRVEVVPTFYHWESVYVANVVPLARGWERQSDVTLSPLFYRSGPISTAAYHRWLVASGVRWVAVPATKLDYGGTAEAAAIDRGVPGLRLAWRDARWRIYSVAGSNGLVAGPATVTGVGNASVSLRTERAATVTVRVRDNADWRITAGTGCLAPAADHWIALRAPAAESVTLRVSFSGRPSACG